MFTLNQRGTINILLFPLIAAVVLLIGSVSFGYWAYTGRQDYKNNTDQKIAAATAAAVQAEDIKKDAQFAEVSQNPLKTYEGPASYGSLRISYPKTWSAYIDTSGNGSTVVNGYFYPDFVPASDGNSSTPYALRVEIINSSYSSTLQQLVSSSQGGPTVTPYALPNEPNIIGTRLEGSLSQNISGSMVLLPLRDKTLEIWTEAAQFEDDFNNTILPSVTFSP